MGDRNQSWRQVLTAFALLALCVRALVPGGYMLGGQAADGTSVLVTLCSQQGPMQIAIDLDTGAVRQDQNSDHSQKADAHAPCVFAAMGALPAPDVAALPAGFVFHAAENPPRDNWVRPGLGLAAPPPPAIGPPSLV